MNFSAKLRLYFHICKSFLEKLLKKLWTPYISFSLHVSSSCSSMPSSWHSLLCQLPSFLPPYYIVGPAVLLPCCSSILRLSLSATVIFQQKSYWIKKRIFNNMGGEKGKNLYNNCLRSAETLSKTVLINGVWIWAIRIVM